MYTEHGVLCGGAKELEFCKPVKSGRISSHYGMRTHPIKQVLKMHKGVDYAAPRGTPVVASACGIVESASYKSGFGNLVCLRHAGGVRTRYAHLDRCVAGLRRGQFIPQGKVIGYVGATGHATGPHLHFEVCVGSKPCNPMAFLKRPRAVCLNGRDHKNFLRCVSEMNARYNQVR